MGEVYKARDTRLDRIVAINVSKEHFGEPFANEARAVAAFKNYGTLRVGAVADVAMLELQEGVVGFVDNYKGKRTGQKQLKTYAVVLGSKKAG